MKVVTGPEAVSMWLTELARALERYRYDTATELNLQDGIDQVLQLAHVLTMNLGVARREVAIGKDRIDFMVGDIGIEVKIGGSLTALTRQIHGYLQDDAIKGLLVVTTRSSHRAMPAEINGKPVRVCYLMGSML